MPTTDAAALLAVAHDAHRAGDLEAAIRDYRAALAAGADAATAYNDMGMALRALGKGPAAIACYRQALAAAPDAGEVWSNLGNALRDAGRLGETAACLKRAFALEPTDPDIAYNAGVAFREAGDAAAALPALDAAVAQKPEDAQLRFERAFAHLTLGRCEAGFADYESRFEIGQINKRSTKAPEWRGEPLDGRSLLVLAEQGHGDLIQFARLLPRLTAMTAGQVTVECHTGLVRLFRGAFPDIAFVEADSPLPPHDLFTSFLSLPHLLGLTAPADAPGGRYLKAPAPGAFDRLIGPSDGRLKVGLTWSGNQNNPSRSCPFPLFAGLLEVPNVDFYSLQRGEPRADIIAHGLDWRVADIVDDLSDFADDAAVLERLDLMITIDTAISHLSAALGRPTWTLLAHVADWRHGEELTQSPWHPTMRLFRQPAPGDWPAVVADVRAALTELAG